MTTSDNYVLALQRQLTPMHTHCRESKKTEMHLNLFFFFWPRLGQFRALCASQWVKLCLQWFSLNIHPKEDVYRTGQALGQ